MESYDSLFFRYAPQDITSLYFDLHPAGVTLLTLGKATEIKPNKGFLLSYKDLEEESFVEKIIALYPSLHHVYLLANSPLSTFIPGKIFKEEDRNLYLNVLDTLEDSSSSLSYCDYWGKDKSYLVYKIPLFVQHILKNIPHAECYHTHTAIDYIIKKKSFLQYKTYIATFINQENKTLFIQGRKQDKILFTKSYSMDSPADINYYLQLCLEHFFKDTQEKIQLLFFSTASNVKDVIFSSFQTPDNRFYLTFFSVHDICRLYNMKPTLTLENYFFLLLLSLCEL